MKKNIPLNDVQRNLVDQHLYLADDVIKYYINTNESIQGMGIDDLRQTGYLLLCYAALKFDGRCKFSTFARVCVKNGLLDVCRRCNTKQKFEQCHMEDSIPGNDNLIYSDILATPYPYEEFDDIIKEITLKKLAQLKEQYHGITLKGIEAMELKFRGYSGRDIADLYGVNTKLLYAWISRAKQKLAADGELPGLRNDC